MDVIDKIKLKGDEYKDLAKATQEDRRKCAQSMQRQCKNLAKLHKRLAKTAQDDWRKLAISWIKSYEN